MEKEHQPDSMATVTMKPDYPPSEIYSTSEPPPAYRHPKSTAVQIAKIAALTVILSSVVLGSFLLAASYVQARASCQQMEQLDAMLDRELALEARQMHTEALMQDEPLPMISAQALLQSAPPALEKKSKVDALQAQDSSNNEEKLQSIDEKPEQSNQDESSDSNDNSESPDSSESSDSSDSSENSAEVGREPIRITLPLQLDFDELAGALIEKNQRSRMNCVVEKRRAEELVDHQPRSVRLPFGLNLTTDPRLERVTGERMAIFCESGDDNRQIPDAAEILGGFPVPLPGPMRMPLHFPIPSNQFQQRPPMPAQHMQAPAPQAPPQFQQMPFQPQIQRNFPPQFAGQQFPPQFIQQQFPHQPRFHSEEQRFQPEQQRFPQEQQRFIPEQHRFQPEAQRFQPEPQRFQPEPQQMQSEPQLFRAEQTNFRNQQPNLPPQLQHVLQMALIPREVRIHVQRVQLPHVQQEQVPQDTHVSEEESAEHMPQQSNMPMISVAELRAVEQAVRAAEEDQAAQQRAEEQDTEEVQSSSHEMLGRQAMARAIPVNIPVPMMPHQVEEVPSEESQRPHYVQPRSVRSVRSVDNLLRREKRVKRCSCDCAC